MCVVEYAAAFTLGRGDVFSVWQDRRPFLARQLRDLEFLERKGLRYEFAVGEDTDSNRKND